ncbi:MAG: YeeE/YedE family protein [Candidatus Dadabacteria bacterium]|nr:YeeE/YedE family protein [Candidatus Dadabacteria bacterium]NIV40876.1 YeeE/YedE family protein [Candidatus Dadabacteria bacterium]NIX16215.1 YeeE/YedE family protein [Candidatus Dadabacteria bacterium]NIY22838.1 YeeE/YedE family protein [Candidatus Dadabacteria bacterium]
MEIILAIVFGTLFGFALHRVGASNPENIINMLRLTDLHLMKAIMFAVGISSAILFIGTTIGFIDAGHFSVKSSYIGVIIGGAILGLGFATAGYCPGTGIAALGDGRKDAVSFIIGGLLGALVYMLVFGGIKGSALFNKIAGGKVSLAVTGNDSYPALLANLPGIAVALILAIVFILVAWKLPKKL